jgi:hypothetical protein
MNQDEVSGPECNHPPIDLHRRTKVRVAIAPSSEHGAGGRRSALLSYAPHPIGAATRSRVAPTLQAFRGRTNHRPSTRHRMAHATVKNQQKILSGHREIVSNQKKILRNQERLMLILANEVIIIRNQEAIIKNQKKILANQAKLGAR